MAMDRKKDTPSSYPCFSSKLLRANGMTLHLSTACNLRCKRCVMERDSGGVSSLGRTGMIIMTADGAFELLQRYIDRSGPPPHIQIGGLGEPLLDAGTYVLIRQLHATYPDLPVSVWTNGILLSDRLTELVRSGMSGIVISINAVSQDTADKIYNGVTYRGRHSIGRNASHLILNRQWNGLSNAVEAGVETIVCTTRMQGVNEHEIDRIGSKARTIGADRVEIIESDR